MKYSVNALHKSATVFLLRYFERLANIKQYRYYSRDRNNEKGFDAETSDCIRCPARGFPKKLNSSLFYIIVFRNPLDTLVSEYYSFGWMHTVKGTPKEQENLVNLRNEIQNMTVDEYCLKYANVLLEKLRFLTAINLQKTHDKYLALTYEDMVLKFNKWNKKVSALFNLNEKESFNLYNAFKGEFQNLEELKPNKIFQGKKRHKRKALPGDHKEKLKPMTIGLLNNTFKDILKIHRRISF